LSSSTRWSAPPTISSVGARTWASAGEEGGGGAGAGAEVADPQLRGLLAVAQPVGGAEQAAGEQVDVEAEPGCAQVDLLLLGGEQVDQERTEP
jgi:hypothetical protein